MQYDLLHIQGKPFVLVPLHDYRDMNGEQQGHELPSDILDALAAGQENPLKIMRKHFKLTQAELAHISGVSRPYIAEIETGKKDGSLRALKSLATAMNINMSVLT